MFSAQPSCSGNTAPRRSSARMRCSGMGTFCPPSKRSTASARLAFQRQRLENIGAASAACARSSASVARRTMENTLSSGKLCWAPSDSTMPSSVAAACSSKLKLAQKRLRIASARAMSRVGGPLLQLEVEADQEGLGHRQPEGAIDATAEGRVYHELHPAALVEELLRDDRAIARHHAAERRLRLDQVGDHLLGS